MIRVHYYICTLSAHKIINTMHLNFFFTTFVLYSYSYTFLGFQ